MDWPHQIRGVAETLDAIESGEKRIALTSPTGGGKCLGRGTSVLMFDGALKAVEKIVVGDLVMGPDSRSRTVLSTCQGREPLYRVTPLRGGEPFTCNGSHILSLKMSNGSSGYIGSNFVYGSVVNVSVESYLQRSQWFRHCAKLYRTGIDFPDVEVPLEPYFLGVWLGDGTSNQPSVTTADEEVVAYIGELASANNLNLTRNGKKNNKVPTYSLSAPGRARRLGNSPRPIVRNGPRRWHANPIRDSLRSLDLFNNKHIPHIYKTNCRRVRLEVLAGLIDSDGHLHRSGCYDLVFKVEAIARDVAFIARSLGFSSFVRKCVKTCRNNGVRGEYYRVSVYGDVDEIPVCIDRKRSPVRRQKKNHLVTGFSIETVGEGDYFGFELDGDSLFLLGDFTVTHNSRMMQRLIERFTDDGLRTACFINRRMLIDQLSRNLDAAGIRHGVRAAGHEADLNYPVQICSIQTEHARKIKWDRFPAQRILVDEAHLLTGESHRLIFDAYESEGAVRIGLTATPLDIGSMYDRLIVAGNNTELRACGALVPAIHYGPDEPDLRKLKGLRDGVDLTEKQQRQAMKSPSLWARVIEWYRRLNPDQKPTILFAPGVPESLWFAEQFSKAGIKAAHIDGQEVWWNGEFYKSDKDVRDEILKESREGGCKVLCNRFVLREGIDCPWLAHGIFATVFGSLQSYLQAGGRLLRTFPGLETVSIQDHGGNWHRHGSLNSDRDWDLSLTGPIASGLRLDHIRNKQEAEPARCPQCARILIRGKCQGCGFEFNGKRSRPVVQEDGTLKEMSGDIYRPRRVSNAKDAADKWKKMYYRARSKKWNATFNQAAAMFAQENNWAWPSKELPLMPIDPMDFYRRVADVPREKLRN